MTNPIVCTCYFPSIQYLQTCFQFNSIQIEQHENYPKQTLRNRCFILSPNGVQCLTVPVQHASREKTLTKDVKISYDATWQRQHWRSLEAAYNRSAFFEFYKDELSKIFLKHHTYLIDLNESLLIWMTQKLKRTIKIHRTGKFMEESSFQFLSDKKNNTKALAEPIIKSYPQVFATKYGFVPNLSGIDLIFNTGNAASSYLK